MGDLFTWNSLSKLMAGKEGADMLFGAFRYLFGKPSQPAGSNSEAGHTNDGTQKAKPGGKGNDEEHNSLIAMAEAYFEEKGLAATSPEASAVTRTRFSRLMVIFKTLREQNKVGGAEKLMQIIGHESHLQGTAAKTRASQGSKPDGQPERIDIHNVRERTNPAGKLIIRFLTDLETQEAVDLLVASSITDNSKDATAAVAKTVADKGDEIWTKLKGWYGENDTRVHVFLATLATSRETVNRILASPRAVELWAAVEAAPEGERRARHEAFQSFLLQMVREFQSPTIQATLTREAGVTPPLITLKRIVVSLSILCLVLVAVIGVL